MNLENKKQVATIALAVGLGLVAAFLMAQYISGEVQTRTAQLAKNYEQKSNALIQEIQDVRGQMDGMHQQQELLAKKISEQKVIIQQQVAAAPSAGPAPVTAQAFSLQTPPGKRAFTMRIPSLNAVGGLIAPGDTVDIIGHLNIPQESDAAKTQPVTTILFQNILVLAVNTDFEFTGQSAVYAAQQNSPDLNVTFAVDSDQANLLAFAQGQGSFQLVLRSPTERETKVIQVASWDSLANYVMESQGTELIVPEKKASIQEKSGTEKADTEVKPMIQIFKSGQESNF
jgi:Flp pilus assembly protein CpaB